MADVGSFTHTDAYMYHFVGLSLSTLLDLTAFCVMLHLYSSHFVLFCAHVAAILFYAMLHGSHFVLCHNSLAHTKRWLTPVLLAEGPRFNSWHLLFKIKGLGNRWFEIALLKAGEPLHVIIDHSEVDGPIVWPGIRQECCFTSRQWWSVYCSTWSVVLRCERPTFKYLLSSVVLIKFHFPQFQLAYRAVVEINDVEFLKHIEELSRNG